MSNGEENYVWMMFDGASKQAFAAPLYSLQ